MYAIRSYYDIFENLVKDALYNMFDYASLESHLLLDAGIKPPPDYKGSRGNFLKNILVDCIESLKPQDVDYDFTSNEWRSYIILSQRFIENVNSTELARITSYNVCYTKLLRSQFVHQPLF